MKQGCDVNRRDRRGQTVLHVACECGLDACTVAGVFLTPQSDINAVDRESFTCMATAARFGNFKLVSFAFCEGCGAGSEGR